MPIVALLVWLWQRSLRAVYLGVSGGYLILCVLLSASLLRLDWDVLAREAEARVAVAAPPAAPQGSVQEDGSLADGEPKPAAGGPSE